MDANRVDERDRRYLRVALGEARRAGLRGEVPVGAIIVIDETIVGRGGNRPVETHDPTAHAEIVALRRAARRIENYRLTGAEAFVTVEPCPMCCGAFVHARIARVVFGATDARIGALTNGDFFDKFPRVNHRFEVRGGVLAADCGALLSNFFEARRELQPTGADLKASDLKDKEAVKRVRL